MDRGYNVAYTHSHSSYPYNPERYTGLSKLIIFYYNIVLGNPSFCIFNFLSTFSLVFLYHSLLRFTCVLLRENL